MRIPEVRRLAIFILLAVSSGAFAGNPIKKADSLLLKIYNKVDYDTTYINRSPGKIGLKLWGSLSGSRLKARGDNLNSTLRPDTKGTVSLEFDYYDLAIEIATNMKGFSGSKRDFSINCNFYPRRFVLDVSYQKTWSVIRSTTANSPTTHPSTSSMCRRSRRVHGLQACRIRAAVSIPQTRSQTTYLNCASRPITWVSVAAMPIILWQASGGFSISRPYPI